MQSSRDERNENSIPWRWRCRTGPQPIGGIMTITTAGPSTSVVDVAGVTTTFRRTGAGRPVLYLHGAFFPTRWLPFHDALAQSVDLVAPVHPGYAEGHPPGWLRGFDDLVLHYRSLLDVLDLDRVDLVGYDLGGWLGAQIAAHYPERIRTFTAIAPSGLWLPEAPMFEFLNASREQLEAALFGGPAGEHGYLLAAADDIEAYTDAYGENGVTARLIWERRYDVGLARRVALIDVPAQVIAPVEDHVVPVVHAQRWAELLPQGRLVTLDAVDHALIIQAPSRVAQAVTSFIEEVAA